MTGWREVSHDGVTIFFNVQHVPDGVDVDTVAAGMDFRVVNNRVCITGFPAAYFDPALRDLWDIYWHVRYDVEAHGFPPAYDVDVESEQP